MHTRRDRHAFDVADGAPLVYDLAMQPDTPAEAIALDDVLATRVGARELPGIMRIWENGPALVLPRRRYRDAAVAEIVDRKGTVWPLCPRSSGGAGVAHGPGTLNLSLILPLRGARELSIERGYELWIALLASAVRNRWGLSVGAGRAERAFCVGDWDAIADGRKIAGTAQTRRQSSVLVHGTILLDVDRQEYVQLVSAVDRVSYDPERLVSLRELIGDPVSADSLEDALVDALLAALRSRDQEEPLAVALRRLPEDRLPLTIMSGKRTPTATQ